MAAYSTESNEGLDELKKIMLELRKARVEIHELYLGISLFSKIILRTMRIHFLVLLLFICSHSMAQSSQQSIDAFTVENYYKVKWGFAEEFIGLWKANHYPLLKKAMEKGDIISVIAENPKLHSGEDTRWDFRVTIVFKTAELAFDHNLTEPYKKLLYPNLEKLAKDEKYRFELLLAHWDVMTEKIELNK